MDFNWQSKSIAVRRVYMLLQRLHGAYTVASDDATALHDEYDAVET